jgi:hypothetical protein
MVGRAARWRAMCCAISAGAAHPQEELVILVTPLLDVGALLAEEVPLLPP